MNILNPSILAEMEFASFNHDILLYLLQTTAKRSLPTFSALLRTCKTLYSLFKAHETTLLRHDLKTLTVYDVCFDAAIHMASLELSVPATVESEASLHVEDGKADDSTGIGETDTDHNEGTGEQGQDVDGTDGDGGEDGGDGVDGDSWETENSETKPSTPKDEIFHHHQRRESDIRLLRLALQNDAKVDLLFRFLKILNQYAVLGYIPIYLPSDEVDWRCIKKITERLTYRFAAYNGVSPQCWWEQFHAEKRCDPEFGEVIILANYGVELQL